MASLPHCKNQYHNNADDNNNDNDKTTTKTTTINISYCSQIVKASPDSLLQRAQKSTTTKSFVLFYILKPTFREIVMAASVNAFLSLLIYPEFFGTIVQ